MGTCDRLAWGSDWPSPLTSLTSADPCIVWPLVVDRTTWRALPACARLWHMGLTAHGDPSLRRSWEATTMLHGRFRWVMVDAKWWDGHDKHAEAKLDDEERSVETAIAHRRAAERNYGEHDKLLKHHEIVARRWWRWGGFIKVTCSMSCD